MNLLFLTLVEFETLHERNIYSDLLRAVVKNGHDVFIISPVEKRNRIETHLINENHVTILRLKIGNTQKTSIIEKGVSTVMIEPLFKSAIKKFFSDVRFDLVLYTTPPITLVSAIEYVKKRDGAKTYLLLKDIFPQNAVDIGLLSTKGIKGVLYRHFRRQEKRLYEVSDRIGCMSPANVNYVIRHNPGIDPTTVEVCPNSIEVVDKSVDEATRKLIRQKYEIPTNKNVYVYGGNLGKPQGIPFLVQCIRKCQVIDDVFFLIIGDGTEYHLIEKFIKSEKPENVKLMKRLPKDDYDTMVGACDVGLLFLDYRFTIPNFPSRLLSYLQAKLPVLACTDDATDIGKIIVDGGFGWWCESNDVCHFVETVKESLNNFKEKRLASFSFLKENYAVDLHCNKLLR